MCFNLNIETAIKKNTNAWILTLFEKHGSSNELNFFFCIKYYIKRNYKKKKNTFRSALFNKILERVWEHNFIKFCTQAQKISRILAKIIYTKIQKNKFINLNKDIQDLLKNLFQFFEIFYMKSWVRKVAKKIIPTTIKNWNKYIQNLYFIMSIMFSIYRNSSFFKYSITIIKVILYSNKAVSFCFNAFCRRSIKYCLCNWC